MKMSLPIIIIILIVFLLVVFGPLIFYRYKYRDSIKKDKEEIKTFTKSLEETKHYLKYKKDVTLYTLIITASTILLSLSLIFFIFLPIFQIKIELFGITIGKQNFSLYDNYIDLKSEYNGKMHYFTDADADSFMIIIATVIALIYFPINCYFVEIKSFDPEKRAKKAFINVKFKKFKLFDRGFLPLYILIVALLIGEIIAYKNAEFILESSRDYTITNIDNYLYYYSYNGEFILRVYQNKFKFFNAVSGYIALPIICILLSITLYLIGLYLKNNYKKTIKQYESCVFNEL